MATKEEKIKDKMLALLERAIDDPHLIEPAEWSKLFGSASIARAMSIVSKLKGRPAEERATLEDGSDGLTLEEAIMWRDWLTLEEVPKLTQLKCHGTYGDWCDSCRPPAESLRD